MLDRVLGACYYEQSALGDVLKYIDLVGASMVHPLLNQSLITTILTFATVYVNLKLQSAGLVSPLL